MVNPAMICYNPTLGQSVIPTTRSGPGGKHTSCYNPTLGQSVIPTLRFPISHRGGCLLQSHARAIRHSDANLGDCACECVVLQSHARAIRHSDRDHIRIDQWRKGGYNPTLGQSVIPTTTAGTCLCSICLCYNPTLGQSVIPTRAKHVLKHGPFCYNPTLGQSVIPTESDCSNSRKFSMVTIPRSGNPSFRRTCVGISTQKRCVTIPRSGNPSFRHRLNEAIARDVACCYNPTLGQSVIPTKESFS